MNWLGQLRQEGESYSLGCARDQNNWPQRCSAEGYEIERRGSESPVPEVSPLFPLRKRIFLSERYFRSENADE